VDFQCQVATANSKVRVFLIIEQPRIRSVLYQCLELVVKVLITSLNERFSVQPITILEFIVLRFPLALPCCGCHIEDLTAVIFVVHVAPISWSIGDAHATRRARPKRALAHGLPHFNLGLAAGMLLERLCWNGLILLSDGLDGCWPAYPGLHAAKADIVLDTYIRVGVSGAPE